MLRIKQRIFRRRRKNTKIPKTSDEDMISERQILIVEDNLINRELLVESFAERNTVLQAENGYVAPERLKQNKDSISLILLDVMMPAMDGYTFLDKLRRRKQLPLSTVQTTLSQSHIVRRSSFIVLPVLSSCARKPPS